MGSLDYNNISNNMSNEDQDNSIHADPFTAEGFHLLQPAGLMYPNESTDDNITGNNNTAMNSNNMNSSPNKVRRNRAKGETLNILKRQFNLKPNPTPQERRQIAKLVNMNEKSVTIWFQNKRAKIKRNNRQKSIEQEQENKMYSNNNNNIDNNNVMTVSNESKKRRFNRDNMDSDSDDSGIYREKNHNQHVGGEGDEEDEQSDMFLEDGKEINFFDKVPLDINNNYYFIDICSILVGSWNRIKSGSILSKKFKLLQNLKNLSPRSVNDIMLNSTDLLVLISKKNFEINYFFSAMTNNCKILFRIFYPIDNVVDCSISLNSDELISNNNNNNHGNNTNNSICSELKLTINKSPNFAVYFLNENVLDTQNQWSICEDFSEGKQVNDAFIGGSNLPHILKGLQDSLKFMNSLILDYKATNQIISPPSPVQLPLHLLPITTTAVAATNTSSMDGHLDKSIIMQSHDVDIPISVNMAIPDASSFQSLSDPKFHSQINDRVPQDHEHNNNILFGDNRHISYDTISNTNNNINLLHYQDSINTSSSAYSPALQFDRNNLNIPYNTIHNQIDNSLYAHDNISSSIMNHIDNKKNNSNISSSINNTSTMGTSLNPHDLDNINLTPSSFFFDHQDYLSSTTNDQIYTSLHQSTVNYDNTHNAIHNININNVNMDKSNNLLDDTN